MSAIRTTALTLTGALVVAGAVGLVLWAPWSSADGTAVSSRWTPVHAAICDAARDADAGEVAAARRGFYDHAHEPLHDLARRAAGDERDVAARLLEAKWSSSEVPA